MEIVWKAVGTVLVTVILVLTLEKQGKDFSILLTVAVTGMLAAVTVHLLEPVIDFLRRLEKLADLNLPVLHVMIKILGIGLTGEISSDVCADAGSSALGRGLRLLANAAIVSLSVPLFSALLDIIRQLLRGL